jgi:predicted GNAT family acetyltransferase
MNSEEPAPRVEHHPSRRRFEINSGGRMAFLSYEREAGRMIIEHTFVPEALRGRGIAGLLVRAALEEVRHAGLQVVSRCSYAAAFIRRTPEFADLVTPET